MVETNTSLFQIHLMYRSRRHQDRNWGYPMWTYHFPCSGNCIFVNGSGSGRWNSFFCSLLKQSTPAHKGNWHYYICFLSSHNCLGVSAFNLLKCSRLTNIWLLPKVVLFCLQFYLAGEAWNSTEIKNKKIRMLKMIMARENRVLNLGVWPWVKFAQELRQLLAQSKNPVK